MPFELILKELAERRVKALAMGGPEKLAKRKAEGQLNARERVDLLLDPDTFFESGMLATSIRPAVRDKTPADGKVCGFGRIAGREVAVISNDFTVMGASSALINSKKMRHMKVAAMNRGLPLIFLGESTGGRIPDRMGSSGRTIVAQDPNEFLRLRHSPWVSALLGDCYGSSTWYACASDFVVMRKGATMAVASAKVASAAINQPIDKETLGGWKLLTEKSGLADMAVDTDEEAIAAIKRFLSYLPSHRNEPPPVHAVPPESDEGSKQILEVFPESRTKVYDLRKIVELIVDKGSMFEMKPRYAKNLVSALARLDGRSVGIIGNNPMFKGGALDADACNKVLNFIVLCDSFNIPIIFLVDVPGFLIGLEGEMRGVAGKIINWMSALALVSVPRISVILRKSYGKAYPNMGAGANSDEVACWPTADLGFMDARVGVRVLHDLKEEDDPVRYAQLVAEIEADSSAWALAQTYEAQAVIDPRETRNYLIRALEVHRMRLTNGVGLHRLADWPTSY